MPSFISSKEYSLPCNLIWGPHSFFQPALNSSGGGGQIPTMLSHEKSPAKQDGQNLTQSMSFIIIYFFNNCGQLVDALSPLLMCI